MILSVTSTNKKYDKQNVYNYTTVVVYTVILKFKFICCIPTHNLDLS